MWEISPVKGDQMKKAFNLLSAEGRISVGQYWLSRLASFALAFVAVAVIRMADHIKSYDDNLGLLAISIFIALGALSAIAVAVYIAVAASIKRLHDLDVSGWFFLLSLIPLIN